MLWIALIILSTVAWAVSVSLQRLALRGKSTVVGFSVVYLLVSALLMLPFAFFSKLPTAQGAWITFTLSILIGTISVIFFRLQWHFVDVPSGLALATMETIFVFTLGIMLLGESFSYLKLVGLATILVGIIFSSIKAISRKLLKAALAVVFIASLLSAVLNVIDKYNMQFFDPFFYAFCACLFPGLILLPLLRGKRLKQTKELVSKKKWLIIGSALFTGIGYLLLMFAYKMPGTEVSVIYPFSQFMALVAIPISAAITGEKQNLLYKAVGAIIATIGTILMVCA